MRLKIVKRWKGYKLGAVITPGEGVANLLVKRGFAVPVVETATADGAAERAVGFRQRSKGR